MVVRLLNIVIVTTDWRSGMQKGVLNDLD